MWQILGKEDKMKKFNLKKLTVTAILAAVAVVGSLFSFPVFGSKCAPVQHLVNILCAVTVGPWWALAQAFIAALIRNLLGLGSPLAFPGSMCGALLGGLLYKYGKKLPFAYIGEVVGTGIIGAGLSRTQASAALDALLNHVNTDLRTRMNVKDKNATVMRVSQNTFEEAASELVNSKSDKVVRIVSAGNIMVGEPVVVDFAIYDNRKIFNSGAVILSAPLSSYDKGANNQGRILMFLHDVNRLARDKGILFDPLTGNIGQLNAQELTDVIRQVNEYGGNCILTAVAKRDIYTEGPLVIDVHVEKVEE